MGIRFMIFTLVFVLMAALERLYPKRKLVFAYRRWPANLGVSLLNIALLSLLPFSAVWGAWWAEQHAVGLLLLFELPFVVQVLLSLLLLDMLIYAQHRLFHIVPMLWRLHRMHHADCELDVSSGVRFHPLEAILSMLIKCAAIIALGVPVLAVVIFEVGLNAMAMFNHANVRLPRKLDAVLRLLWVTPDMHRIHHSVLSKEYNQNYGFNLSVWDRLFGSYCAEPEGGQKGMRIGLMAYQHEASHALPWMLRLPFQRHP